MLPCPMLLGRDWPYLHEVVDQDMGEKAGAGHWQRNGGHIDGGAHGGGS